MKEQRITYMEEVKYIFYLLFFVQSNQITNGGYSLMSKQNFKRECQDDKKYDYKKWFNEELKGTRKEILGDQGTRKEI